MYAGIKDYIKDCWHDFICREAWRMGLQLRRQDTPKGYTDDEYYKRWYYEPLIKEGSVWHYIRQRRNAKRNKKNETKTNRMAH